MERWKENDQIAMKKTTLILLIFAAGLAACASQPSGPALTESQQIGQRLFTQDCSACHAIKGTTVIVGPPLTGIAITGGQRVEGQDAATYIERSITAPSEYIVEGYQDLMVKNFADQLTDAELQGLVDYLMTFDQLPSE